MSEESERLFKYPVPKKKYTFRMGEVRQKMVTRIIKELVSEFSFLPNLFTPEKNVIFLISLLIFNSIKRTDFNASAALPAFLLIYAGFSIIINCNCLIRTNINTGPTASTS